VFAKDERDGSAEDRRGVAEAESASESGEREPVQQGLRRGGHRTAEARRRLRRTSSVGARVRTTQEDDSVQLAHRHLGRSEIFSVVVNFVSRSGLGLEITTAFLRSSSGR